jgi:periplasmic copper chaperone A
MPRRTARLLAGAVVMLASVVGAALPAAAHVTVQPSTATQGSFSELSFRVPTERDDASTTQVEVTFPSEQPLAFFSVKPRPGWDYEVTRASLPEPVEIEGTTITEAVSKVVWTAQSAAAAIGPGEYDDFSVSVGFLPEDDQMVFKALQTYDSGEVVSWIEEAAEGAEEPERPAPTLTLTPPADESSESDGAATAPVEATLAAATSGGGSDGSDGLAVTLAVVGALLGAVGAVLGGLAWRRSRAAD